MTSPPPTRGTARYRCDTCARDLTAAQALLAHVADPGARRIAICPGVPQPIAVVVEVVTASADTLPIARDDRAGVTLEIGVQPIGGDQFVPVGAGEGEQGGDAGDHENNVRSTSAAVTANADVDGTHAFAREAACPR